MRPYRLPLKFILLWVANLAVLVALEICFGFTETILVRQQDRVSAILILGAVMALLEQWLWDKLKGNE